MNSDLEAELMFIPTEISILKWMILKLLILLGHRHSLALDKNRLYGYGLNHRGQCGDGICDEVKQPNWLKH